MSKGTAMLNWGIVGCGDVCEVKSGPAFNLIPDSRLRAVMRRDVSKAEDFARRHKVPLFFGDAEELVHHPDVNAIYIATPPSSHEMYVEMAIRAGKPVYVEKPVALDAASCERMIALQKEYNVPVSVAHYRRGMALFRRVREVVREGAIGQVRLVELRTLQADRGQRNWRLDPAVSGGGLFYDLAPHQLDLLYWIFGMPDRVYATSLNQSRKYTVPDFTVLSATFAGVIFAHGTWAFDVAPNAAEDRCEVIGDKGRLTFSFFGYDVVKLETDKGITTEQYVAPPHVQEPMIRQVCTHFSQGGENPCSLEDALVVARMMERAGK